MPTLSDTRNVTIDDTDAMLEEMAHLRAHIVQAEARRERQINRAKSTCQEETADARARFELLEARLDRGILANEGSFREPRTRKTPFGRYGMRKASGRANVTDKKAVIAWAQANDRQDCIKPTVDKAAVLRCLRRGENIPGAIFEEGQRTWYKIDPAVLKEPSS